MESEFEFPQFRKYKGRSTWFKIISPAEFIEVSFVGSNKQVHEVVAIQFPEKLLIQDMLICKNGRWEIVSAKDFESAAT